MLKEKLDRLNLTDLMNRAEEVFEKKSGWKHRDVKATLDNFRGLDRMNQVLLGGLLVGQALMRRGGGTELETQGAGKVADTGVKGKRGRE
jgi:hypothetical protein